MHHKPLSPSDPNVSLPFKFTGGFGIDSRRIGAIFTIMAISSMLVQFLLFPVLARRWGVLTCLRIAFLIFPVVYFVTPFVALIPNQSAKQVVMIALLIVRGFGGTFAFPTSTIMLTNSASSLRVLGTLNGFATSVSAVGRATGPAFIGELFTWSLKKGYVVIPFWTLSFISLVAFVPTLWLVEGKGFGDDPDSDVESVVSASAPWDMVEAVDEDALSESEYGEPGGLLGRASTRDSEVMTTDDEEEVGIDRVGSRGRRGTGESAGLDRMVSRRSVRRRSSVPFGMGVGFRRLSSNIGSTGIGAGGASWGGT
jgi:MFS family permease